MIEISKLIETIRTLTDSIENYDIELLAKKKVIENHGKSLGEFKKAERKFTNCIKSIVHYLYRFDIINTYFDENQNINIHVRNHKNQHEILGLPDVLDKIHSVKSEIEQLKSDLKTKQKIIDDDTGRTREREAEARSYRNLCNELKKLLNKIVYIWFGNKAGREFVNKEPDAEITSSNLLSKTTNKFQAIMNDFDEKNKEIYLLKGYKRRAAIFEAKATKANAEKRKLLEIIRKEAKAGDVISLGMLDDYDKYLKQRRRKSTKK